AGVRVLAGATVLDVRPPPLERRRGAARARAAGLAGPPGAASLLRVHGVLASAELAAMGVTPAGEPVCAGWYADPALWDELPDRLVAAVRRHASAHPLEPGMPVEAARRALGLPDRRLVHAVLRRVRAERPGDALREEGGRIVPDAAGLPAPVADAVRALVAEFAERDRKSTRLNSSHVKIS